MTASSLPPELLLAVVVVGLVGLVALVLLAAGARRLSGRRTAWHDTLHGLMNVRSPEPEARRAMCELLLVCFTAEEFRRFVADLELALTHELLGETCSDATVITHGVDLLLRHARVDLHFFDRWAKLRPRRQSQIFLVAGEMGCLSPQTAVAGAATLPATAAASPLQMAAPPVGQDFDLWLFLAFVLLIVGLVLLFLALRDSPFRVEYTLAAFLIGAFVFLVLMRHYIAAVVALFAGLFVLFWTGIRADRRAALARA